MNDRLIPVTDDRGNLLVSRSETYEPEPGSVVLAYGLTGRAYQRWSDGDWHAINTKACWKWYQLLRLPGLVIVYDAEPRETPAVKAPLFDPAVV